MRRLKKSQAASKKQLKEAYVQSAVISRLYAGFSTGLYADGWPERLRKSLEGMLR
jgi:hypothetical protein